MKVLAKQECERHKRRHHNLPCH